MNKREIVAKAEADFDKANAAYKKADADRAKLMADQIRVQDECMEADAARSRTYDVREKALAAWVKAKELPDE